MIFAKSSPLQLASMSNRILVTLQRFLFIQQNTFVRVVAALPSNCPAGTWRQFRQSNYSTKVHALSLIYKRLWEMPKSRNCKRFEIGAQC